MSEKFTASNGVAIAEDESGLTLSTTDWRKGREAMAEFSLHERDQELGRWRWPENPEYVVYPDGTSRRVVRESTGQMMTVTLHDRKVMTTYLESWVGAAKAYDAAHEPAHEPAKPWHDAKDGHLYILRFDDFPDTDVSALVKEGEFIYNDHCHVGVAPLDSKEIVSARRIWPESKES